MQNVSKILVIRFSSMGDIVLTSPLIRVLRKAFPDSRIDFLVKEEFADLVKYNPHLSSVITLKSGERDELTNLAKTLAASKYDLLFDLHNSLRSRYIRKYAYARSMRIVDKRVVRRFFLVNFKLNLYKEAAPVAERYLETAKDFGVKDDGKGLELFFPEVVGLAVSKRLAGFAPEGTGNIIGIAPAAKHATKRWLAERFIGYGVATHRERGSRFLVFGGNADEEYCGDITAKINSAAGSAIAFNAAGKFSILESAAAIDYCDLMVTNDTGIMHIASARGKKILAIFGSTVKEFGFYPYRAENVVLENPTLSCRPCSHIGLEKCPNGHFKCMADITVADALGATQTLLAGETLTGAKRNS